MLIALGLTLPARHAPVRRRAVQRRRVQRHRPLGPRAVAPAAARLVRARASAADRASCSIHPTAEDDLFLSLGDRVGRWSSASPTARSDCAVAMGIAFYRYHYLRFPAVAAYPGNVAQRDRDGVLRRGRRSAGSLFGLPARDRAVDAEPREPGPGARLRAGDAPRGARPRPWYMLVSMVPSASPAAGSTAMTGGIGAAFLGHAITRVAIFLDDGPRRGSRSRRAPRTRRSSAAAARPRAGGSSARGSAPRIA